MLMRDSSDGSNIWDTVLGVADRLDVDGPCVVVNCLFELGGIVSDYPLDVDLEFA